jgi:Domain of unknown function (DUF4145)
VPTHISAHKCNSIGSRRAATLMARSVVEATAKDKGFETGSLFAKIDAMEEAGILRRVVGHAAHSIRLFGNDMAHGDFIEPVGDDEANMVMSLMNLILDETYRIPAEVSAIEAVAAGRRAPAASAEAAGRTAAPRAAGPLHIPAPARSGNLCLPSLPLG